MESEKISEPKTQKDHHEENCQKTKRSHAKRAERPQLSLVDYVKRSLQDFVITEGMKALGAVLEEEQEALCGPAYKKGASDEAKRWGTAQGRLVFGGQRVLFDRARVRKCGKEVALSSWEEFTDEAPLNDRAFEQMVVGVSTRNYDRSLDEIPSELGAHGTSRSAASRRFSKKAEEQLDAWLSRSLTESSLVAIMIDGIVVD